MTDGVPPKRTFFISDIIPFGARIIVERIECGLGDWRPDQGDEANDGNRNYVRILVKYVDFVACINLSFL